MYFLLLLSLCMSGCTVTARTSWASDKPWINVNSSDIVEGEWVKVLCGVPIDYTGGDCRLYKDRRESPIRLLTTQGYVCEFLVSARELLGRRPVGTRTTVRCDYKLQDYTSVSSDRKAVVVWGTREKPVLTVSPHIASMDGTVEIRCATPLPYASRCRIYRDGMHLKQIPCNHNMTGTQLTVWRKTSLINPITLTCKYDPTDQRYVRSEASDESVILIVDLEKLDLGSMKNSSTMDCKIPVDEQHLAMMQSTTTSFSLPHSRTLIVEARNSSILFNQTCTYV